jgi:hypothetical protein
MKIKLLSAFIFVFNLVAAQVPSDWSATSTYSSGALVISNGTTYIAQQDVNTAGTALTDTSFWLSLDEAAPSTAPSTSAPTTPPDASEVSSLSVPTGSTESKLINISTRGYVGTGADVLIGGFVIEGTDSKQVLVRALGPSLTAQGVTGALSDPFVYLVNQADPTVIVGSNDNWESAQGISAIENNNLFRPGDSKDAAMILTLQPGAYTAIVQGINSATGVALVEVNEL